MCVGKVSFLEGGEGPGGASEMKISTVWKETTICVCVVDEGRSSSTSFPSVINEKKHLLSFILSATNLRTTHHHHPPSHAHTCPHTHTHTQAIFYHYNYFYEE